MKKIVLSLFAVSQLALVACSTNPTAGLNINNQRVAVSNFEREGIRVSYNLVGTVSSVESTAYVPIWDGTPAAVDAAQQQSGKIAQAQLKNFLDKKLMTSPTSASMIAINLQHATEQKNNPALGANPLVASDREVFLDKNGKDLNAKAESSKVRDDAAKLAGLINDNANWSAIASGLSLQSAEQINNNQTLKVVYRWSATN